MRDSNDMRKIVDEIEDIFKNNNYPEPKPFIVRRISFLVSYLIPFDSYVAEKAGEISDLSKIYYSTRKHQKHRGGPEEIYSRIVNDLLNRIRQRLNAIDYENNSTQHANQPDQQ
ncbi:MAG: hypothetical protein OEW48_15770 [Phycisphaerae bacterium]|nr:hypothetical protein [Phycisphaerae bacterium]